MTTGPTGDTDNAAGNGGGPTPTPPPPPAPAPSPAPAPVDVWATDPQRAIAIQLATAEAMKPIEAAAAGLYAPDNQAAQQAIVDKYKKAVAADGDLRKKIKEASTSFDRTAVDMLDRLDTWVPKIAAGPLHDLLEARKATGIALAATLGAREKARNAAVDASKDWAARFADWAAPGDTIDKLVSAYLGQIDKLNADINNEVAADTAILSFWAEIAPRHLQVSDVALSDKAKEALGKVQTALTNAGYADLAARLDPATARAAGAVYMIAADKLADKRAEVLTYWKDAAETLAKAQADFKLAPDDAATLKQRWDKLGGDAWIKLAKAALTPPATA